MAEKRYVDAVFVSANSIHDKPMAEAIEAAMSAAAQACYDAGDIDSDHVRAQMLAAREEIKQVFAEADARAQEAVSVSRSEGVDNQAKLAAIAADVRQSYLAKALP